jgi:hypothetical protein
MSRMSRRREAELENHDPAFRTQDVDVIDNHLARCDGCTAPPEAVSSECPGTKFPDGTHCGEYGWHARDCPVRAADPQAQVARVRELVAAADALRPEDFKTGQDHLPPAFRETNFHDAFMALAHIVEQIEEVVRDG